MDDLDLGSTIKGFSAGQKVFNRYKLVRLLGRGGMGVVWLARDEELEREVALKFLPEVVALDKQAVLELKRETRRSLELTHPHIIRIYDFVQDGRTAAISMEYVAGDTLAARKVDQPGHCFTPDDLAAWVRQLCEALDYAHQRAQIVHRDLKPANLMVDSRGELKIADFGIAASVSDSVSRVSAQTGSSGTPVYMSPQQMMGDRPAVTDDIYSLGATLYDLLTGKPPFHSGNIIAQVQGRVPPTLAERRAELGAPAIAIPAEWEQTLAACLAKEAKDRPPSAREVAQRLGVMGIGTTAPFRAAVRNAPGTNDSKALPHAHATARTERPGEAASAARPSSNANRYAGLAAAVIVVLGGLGWYFGFHAPEQKRLAEIARLEGERRSLEADRLRTEKERADSDAQKKAAEEQQAYAIVAARIDALLDGAPVAQREATESSVRDYLAGAPARFRAEVEARWSRRLAGWDAHRLNLARGGFRIRTNPVGAEVQVGSLALEQSPVTRNDVRLGKYPVVIRAEGYEEWRGEIEVRENDFADPGVVSLTRSTGVLALTSNPAGAVVTLTEVGGEGAVRSGLRAGVIESLPTGRYQLTASFPGLADLSREVTVTRNTRTPVELNFAHGAVELISEPAGAEVWRAGAALGKTPLILKTVAAGDVEFEVRQKGFARAKVGGRLESGGTLSLKATLKKGGLDDPEQVVALALEEIERMNDPNLQSNLLAGLAVSLERLDGAPSALRLQVIDRQLEAIRQVPDPKARFEKLSTGVGTAAALNLDRSRAWAEAAVQAVAELRLTPETKNFAGYADLFWMHPDLADRIVAIMGEWYKSDDDWAYVSMLAGKHMRYGNEAAARRLATRANGPYRNDAIKNNLDTGTAQRVSDPMMLMLLRGEVAEAKRALGNLRGQIDYSVAALLANLFIARGELETARQLGSRLNTQMAGYYPGLLVSYAVNYNRPRFAESVAATMADVDNDARRSTAYRQIAEYYAKFGRKDRAAAMAAQIRNFGNLEYGFDRQATVPVLVAVGDEARARELARSVPASYGQNQLYLNMWNALMFLSLGDKAGFDRCMALYSQVQGAMPEFVYAYQVPMLLSMLGRPDEAEGYLARISDRSHRQGGLIQIMLTRLRMAAPEAREAMVEDAEPGEPRAIMLLAALSLRYQDQEIARDGG